MGSFVVVSLRFALRISYRNYGPFKTQFRMNLEHVVSSRINADVSVSLQPWLVCLIVCGGEDDKIDFVITESAFDVGFSKVQCLNEWAKVGAAPMLWACLTDYKVKRELGDRDVDTNTSMMEVQDANDIAVYTLTGAGYCSNTLKAKLK